MRIHRSLRFIVPLALVPWLAQAHISLKGSNGGPAFGGMTDVFVFGVGHGCEADGVALDTTSVTVEIPAGVTSVRPELSGFDEVKVETDDTGAVARVTWTKSQALSTDVAYYGLRLRMKPPEAPFTKLKFPAHQTCKSADGETEVTTEWVGDEGEEGVEPAPVVTLLPARAPGWNKYTAETDISDLGSLFSDAQIVWQGTAAYSPSASTTELIEETEGATALAKIKAKKEFWVKY
jgi:uncharacterized protein YcnI